MSMSANINKENHFTDFSFLSPAIQLTGLYWKATRDVHLVLHYHSSIIIDDFS
jgi:hypothetical protein